MSWRELVPLAVLLPLFPASMLPSLLMQHVRNAWVAGLFLLIWSQAGVGLLLWLQPDVPQWLQWWAFATAFLYGFRALVLNEVSEWTGFMFVSLLALFWFLPVERIPAPEAHMLALVAVAPLVVLRTLSGLMAARFGSAYLGLVGGLVHGYPRLSGLVALGILAAIATPPFPLFFHLVELLGLLPFSMAVALVTVWYFWGWAGVRLLQRLVLGPEQWPQYGIGRGTPDLSRAGMWTLASVFVGLAVIGLREAMQLAGAG